MGSSSLFSSDKKRRGTSPSKILYEREKEKNFAKMDDARKECKGKSMMASRKEKEHDCFYFDEGSNPNKTTDLSDDDVSIVQGSSPCSHDGTADYCNGKRQAKDSSQEVSRNDNIQRNDTSTNRRRRSIRRPGAQAVAGMRASELNSYASSSRPPVQLSSSDVSLEHQNSTETSGHSSLTSSNSRSIPIQMQHVTVLDETNRTTKETAQYENSKTPFNEDERNEKKVDDEFDPDKDVEMAIEVKVETTRKRCRTWLKSRQGKLVLLSIMLLIFAAIAITVAIFFVKRRPAVPAATTDDDNLESNSTATASNRMKSIQNLLLEFDAASNITALEDPNSMQHEIVAWLAYEDPLQIDVELDAERLVQRYTARFLSMVLLEKPGITSPLLGLSTNKNDSISNIDNAGNRVRSIRRNLMWAPSPATFSSNDDIVMHLNISEHECDWTIQKLNITEYLQAEEDEILDRIQDDDFGDFYYDDDKNFEGYIIQKFVNFTLSCNSKHQITSLSIVDLILPEEEGFPYEVGNLLHLESVQLKDITIERSSRQQGFIGSALGRLQNLSMLEIDVVSAFAANPDMDAHIEGIQNLTQLTILKVGGGVAPVSNHIATLPNLVELSITNMGKSPGREFLFEPNFFRNFASRSTIQKLELSKNSASWTIPSDIRYLTNLTHFICTSNSQVQGTIPSVAIGKLSNLVHLDLQRNSLSSVIPPTLSYLSKLKYIDLSFNDFVGIIPPAIHKLNRLEVLNVANNKLEGALPASGLGSLSNLRKLTLSNNKFYGSLPEEMFVGLFNLEYFEATENFFTGTIPSTLGLCDKLYNLLLTRNRLEGSIPSKLFLPFNLTHVALNGNENINGTLPDTLSNATSLVSLDLSRNALEGSVPSLDKLQELDSLGLYNNRFSDAVPALPKSVVRVDIGANQFTSLPTNEEIHPLVKLESFRAVENRLEGTIPWTMFSLPNIRTLNLKNNMLTGWSLSDENSVFSSNPTPTLTARSGNDDPNDDGFERQLEWIDLSFNQIEGPLPNDIGDVLGSSLKSLNLQLNRFTSTIPSSMGKMKKLKYLDIGENFLNGTIPDIFENVRNLRELTLHFNELTGTIPHSILYLNNLEQIFLQGNDLEGDIDPFCTVHQNVWQIVTVPWAVNCDCCVKPPVILPPEPPLPPPIPIYVETAPSLPFEPDVNISSYYKDSEGYYVVAQSSLTKTPKANDASFSSSPHNESTFSPPFALPAISIGQGTNNSISEEFQDILYNNVTNETEIILNNGPSSNSSSQSSQVLVGSAEDEQKIVMPEVQPFAVLEQGDTASPLVLESAIPPPNKVEEVTEIEMASPDPANLEEQNLFEAPP